MSSRLAIIRFLASRNRTQTILALATAVAMVPLVGVVGLALSVSDLLWFLIRRLRSNRPIEESAPNRDLRASIIVVSWDGRELLERGIPSIFDAIEADGGDHEVIVVDNGSADGSAEFLAKEFPSVRVIALPRNMGFGRGNNIGARAARNPIVVFLNNDMVVDRSFLTPLLEPFRQEEVFAVSSQIFFWDESRRREETGRTRGRYKSGRLELWHADVEAGEETVEPVLWAGGGSCAVDRVKFLTLGGFDTLYEPFYVEDTDLSYRAWKRGWLVLFAPASKVYHKHRATSQRKFGRSYVELITKRNLLLFVWRNITDTRLIWQHVVRLPANLLRLMLIGQPGDARAFVLALLRLPAVISRRFGDRGHAVRTDAEVFKLTSHPVYLSDKVGDSAGAHLTTSIDFGADDGAQLGDGWYSLESTEGKSWRWMGREGRAFLAKSDGPAVLSIEGFTSWPSGVRSSIPVSVYLNQILIRRLEAPASGTFNLTMPVPAGLFQSADFFEVRIVAGATFNWAQAGLGEDRRDLSIAVSRIAIDSSVLVQ